MKTSHRLFFPIIGSFVRVIGTTAVGIVESFEPIATAERTELFVKVRYKNRLTRLSKVSDLGVTLPKFLRFIYPLLDGKKSGKEFVKYLYGKIISRLENFFDRFFSSNLDRVMLAICVLIAATLIVVFTLK